jgi:hypothetical protein
LKESYPERPSKSDHTQDPLNEVPTQPPPETDQPHEPSKGDPTAPPPPPPPPPPPDPKLNTDEILANADHALGSFAELLSNDLHSIRSLFFNSLKTVNAAVNPLLLPEEPSADSHSLLQTASSAIVKFSDFLSIFDDGKSEIRLPAHIQEFSSSLHELIRLQDEDTRAESRIEAAKKQITNLKNLTDSMKRDLAKPPPPKLPFLGFDLLRMGACSELARMTELHQAEMKAIVDSSMK